MNDFDAQLLRLKQALDVTRDQDVASALGLSKQAFSARRKRGSFPVDKVLALVAAKGLDAAYVLTGQQSEPFEPTFEGKVAALKRAASQAEAIGAPQARDLLYASMEAATGVAVLVSNREAALLRAFRSFDAEGKRAVEQVVAALKSASARGNQPQEAA